MVKTEDKKIDDEPPVEIEIDKEEILKTELEKASTNPAYPMLVQTFTG